MSRTGVVVETRGHRAAVSTARRGPCGECTESGECALHIGRVGREVEVVDVDNRIGAQPGDTVLFDLPGHDELKLSMLVWVVPMLGLFAGAVGMVLLAPTLDVGEDAAAILGALIGFAGSYGVLRAVDRRAADRFVPHILRVVDAPSCAVPATEVEPGDGPEAT